MTGNPAMQGTHAFFMKMPSSMISLCSVLRASSAFVATGFTHL